MNKWIDLSLTLDEDYLVYPGDAPIRIEKHKTIEKDKFNLNTLITGMHVGTHMDFKKHMLKTDEISEDFPVNKLIGKANVIRPRIINNIIQTKDIAKAYENMETKARILIIDTGHAKKVNTEVYYKQPKFESVIFAFLKKNNIDVLGVDMPTVVYYDSREMLQMHYDLLGNDITIIENLTNLNELKNTVEFIALPLKFKDMDGSLLRAVAKNL